MLKRFEIKNKKIKNKIVCTRTNQRQKSETITIIS